MTSLDLSIKYAAFSYSEYTVVKSHFVIARVVDLRSRRRSYCFVMSFGFIPITILEDRCVAFGCSRELTSYLPGLLSESACFHGC